MLTACTMLLVAVAAFTAGYLVRRRKSSVELFYAGGTPYRSLRIMSPNGDGSAFAVNVIRELAKFDPDFTQLAAQIQQPSEPL